MKQLLIYLTIVIFSAGCKGPLSSPVKSNDKKGIHKVIVDEVIQAGGYTYLNVSENSKKTWLAVPGMNVSKGDKLSYSDGLEMKDFHSKELNRTFPSILFLESVNNETKKAEGAGVKIAGKMGEVKTEKIEVIIQPEEGSISIAKLLETKSDYSGKTLKVRGKIAKINSAIMGKNWIHIQDGTEFKGAYDLTITTDSQLTVGDTVTFEGKITLKKDFGYGYIYEVIMEDGKPIR
jgi:hypothetical protein